jgi:hypothetical protein
MSLKICQLVKQNYKPGLRLRCAQSAILQTTSRIMSTGYFFLYVFSAFVNNLYRQSIIIRKRKRARLPEIPDDTAETNALIRYEQPVPSYNDITAKKMQTGFQKALALYDTETNELFQRFQAGLCCFVIQSYHFSVYSRRLSIVRIRQDDVQDIRRCFPAH